MDAKILNLRSLFHQQIAYRIPQFQRPYAWGEHVQWKPLWDDICNVALRVLKKEDRDTIRPHFMGAIVLQQQNSERGEVTKKLVVDGQQRLTTLQLLIKATEQVFRSQGDNPRADRLGELTTNQKSHWGGDSDNQTKIRQSNLSDQKAFQEAIRSHDSDKQSGPWAISEAFRYLKVLADDWLNSTLENWTARADALEEALTEHLQMAVIDLDEDEKPHVIFETLNARNEPLKQSDLVKNTVMYEANVIDDDEQAENLWGFFDQEWWRQETKEARLTRIHIDRFLNYWMVMRTLNDIAPNRVASEFRNYLEDKKPSIQTVASEMHMAGLFYAVIEGGTQGIPVAPEMKTFLKRMKAIELGVVTPVLLWLFTSEVPNERQQRCIEMLESYGVRRKLCGLQTQGLNKVFIGLLQALDRDGADHADMAVLHFLSDQHADASVWPNDRMLGDYLPASPIKGSTAWKQMVLDAIETHFRSDNSEKLASTGNLTVEHIMPKAWQTHWPLSKGNENQDEAESAREEAIKQIGNLTLTTEKLTKSLSKGPWSEKRLTLANHRSLLVNRTLLANASEVWNEAVIKRRSRFLVKQITQIWPSADAIMESAA